MKWIEEDSLEYDGFDTITLFRDDENEFMKMVIKLFSDEVNLVVKGEYIEFSVGDNKEYFFAYAISNQSGVTPYKIYRKRR